MNENQEIIKNQINELKAFFSAEDKFCENLKVYCGLLDKNLTTKEQRSPVSKKILNAYETLSDNPYDRLYKKENDIVSFCLDGVWKTEEELTQDDLTAILRNISNQWESQEMRERFEAMSIIRLYYDNHYVAKKPNDFFLAIDRIIKDYKDHTTQKNELKDMESLSISPCLWGSQKEAPFDELRKKFRDQENGLIEIEKMNSKNKSWTGPIATTFSVKRKFSPSFEPEEWLDNHCGSEKELEASLYNLLDSPNAKKQVDQLCSMCAIYQKQLEDYQTTIDPGHYEEDGGLEQQEMVNISDEREFFKMLSPLDQKRINTTLALEIVKNFQSELEKEGVPALQKIDKFLESLDKKVQEVEVLSENNKIFRSKTPKEVLEDAYEGKTFLQRIKEFFGICEKKISPNSFFKTAHEIINSEEISERERIENIKFVLRK